MFKNKKIKKALLTVCLLLTVMITVGDTLAYLFTHTNPVENTFTPVTPHIFIEEEFDGATKENVKVKNTGTVDSYIRAKVITNWIDEDGNILAETPDGARIEDFDYMQGTAWVKYGEYYYYTKPVAPDASTEELIDIISVSYPQGSTFRFNVDIIAQSVQSEGETAQGVKPCQEVWGVTIAENSVTPYPAQS